MTSDIHHSSLITHHSPDASGVSCLGCPHAQGPATNPAARWCQARLGLRYEPAAFGGPYRPRAGVQLRVGLSDLGRVAWMKPPAGFTCPAGAPQTERPGEFKLTPPRGAMK